MFRVVVEYVLGIQPDYDGFFIRPCLPSDWPGASVLREIRGQRYEMKITRDSGGYAIEVNGEKLEGNFVAYSRKQAGDR